MTVPGVVVCIYRRGDYAPRSQRLSKLLNLPAILESSVDGSVGGVLLDELAAGIHVLAHEH